MGSPASPKLTEAQVDCLRRLSRGEDVTAPTMRWLALERRGMVIYCGVIVLKRIDRWRIGDKGRAYLATLDRERDDAMTTHPDSDRRE